MAQDVANPAAYNAVWCVRVRLTFVDRLRFENEVDGEVFFSAKYVDIFTDFQSVYDAELRRPVEHRAIRMYAMADAGHLDQCMLVIEDGRVRRRAYDHDPGPGGDVGVAYIEPGPYLNVMPLHDAPIVIPPAAAGNVIPVPGIRIQPRPFHMHAYANADEVVFRHDGMYHGYGPKHGPYVLEQS